MRSVEDLARARATYLDSRGIRFADGILDAHERLALVTVAARLRHFAFMNHLPFRSRKMVSDLLSKRGLRTRVFNAKFDIDLKTPRVSAASANTYRIYRTRNERFLGLGIWSDNAQGPVAKSVTLTNLGSVLGYPECCVRMDLETKRRDHQLFLRALVKEVGDDPDKVTWGLRRRCAVTKGSDPHLRKWARRYELTLARFPFALHAACDECLNCSSSATATLSESYERLAKDVSEELHFLILWAAHIGSGGRDR